MSAIGTPSLSTLLHEISPGKREEPAPAHRARGPPLPPKGRGPSGMPHPDSQFIDAPLRHVRSPCPAHPQPQKGQGTRAVFPHPQGQATAMTLEAGEQSRHGRSTAWKDQQQSAGRQLAICASTPHAERRDQRYIDDDGQLQFWSEDFRRMRRYGNLASLLDVTPL